MKRMMLTWSVLLLGLVIPSLALKANEDVSDQQNAGPVADRLAIRELIESYNAAVIEKDAAKWIDNWVEDGVWDLGGGNIQGKDRILESWLTIMAPYEYASVLLNPFLSKSKVMKAQRAGTRMNDLNCTAAMRCWPSDGIKTATFALTEYGK